MSMILPCFRLWENFLDSYSMPDAEREQDEFYYKLEGLKKYNPLTEKNINKKELFFDNIQKFYDGREMVINAFL